MQRRQSGRFRQSSSFVASLAFHAALAGLVSIKACGGQSPAAAPAPSGRLVTVEVAAFAPPLRRARTARPGGGVPAQPPARRVPRRSSEPAGPKLAAALPEEPHGREAAVATTIDAIAAPSRTTSAPPLPAGPFGTGPGAHGGPGGPGAGAGGGGPPLVTGNFAFGGATRGRFKGVACFIPRGVVRIADVHGCAPVATFYTNTFDVSERHEPEGFPGISERATWFMIEYTGVFTVARDGTYDFRLHSDDGSYLFIDGQLVIENDGKHKPESRRGSIELLTGEHHLKLLYAQTTDRMALQLYVRVPGGGREQLFTPRI
jgi:hypothetical protein